mmetsp:Transcript_37657/g.67180  ORF Transcript_37657/g.67180 Transcript_37657/m.67180 type:complete len:332 (-) Transcript_37657:2712-3707(-)
MSSPTELTSSENAMRSETAPGPTETGTKMGSLWYAPTVRRATPRPVPGGLYCSPTRTVTVGPGCPLRSKCSSADRVARCRTTCGAAANMGFRPSSPVSASALRYCHQLPVAFPSPMSMSVARGMTIRWAMGSLRLRRRAPPPSGRRDVQTGTRLSTVPESVLVRVRVGVRDLLGVCVRVQVTVRVGVGVAVRVAVSLAVGVGVLVGTAVGLALEVRVWVGVRVRVSVGVDVGTGVGVWVSEGVGRQVTVRVVVHVRDADSVVVGTVVGVGVKVCCMLAEGVAVWDVVPVWVAVAVAVRVGVGVRVRVGLALRLGLEVGVPVGVALLVVVCV